MPWRPGTSRTPIGVDIGRRCVKAAQLVCGRGARRVVAAAVFPLPNPGADVDAGAVRHLRAVLDRQGFTGRSVVLAAPRERLLTSVLELPADSPTEALDRVARAELARIHRCRPDDFEMAYWPLPASGRPKEACCAMAAALPHDSAKPLLDAFEAEGLEVEALDIQAWALARACRPILAGEKNVCPVVDVGWAMVQLALLWRGAVVYERTLPGMGLERLTSDLAGRWGLDMPTVEALLREGESDPPANQHDRDDLAVREELRDKLRAYAEGIAEELKGPLSYAAHQHPDAPVERVFVVGGGAAVAGLTEKLASALGMEVRTVAPTELAGCPEQLRRTCASPALTAAVGLALFDQER